MGLGNRRSFVLIKPGCKFFRENIRIRLSLNRLNSIVFIVTEKRIHIEFVINALKNRRLGFESRQGCIYLFLGKTCKAVLNIYILNMHCSCQMRNIQGIGH
jgi:hypothetical protein